MTETLIDGFERVAQIVAELTSGVSKADLATAPVPGANTPAWLLWHQSRVQDDHVASAFGTEQVWTSAGWYERFDLPFAPEETGYGMTAEQAAQVVVRGELLADYHAEVHARTVSLLRDADDLDRVVDDSYVPPVTLRARLVSVLADDLQHVGQAAYVLGL